MPFLFVAFSKTLSEWGSDVGLSKHLYKIGVADDPDAAVAAGWAGMSDWKLLKKQEADVAEEEAIGKLAGKEKMVDPAIYPKIKGTVGIFKVKPETVENAMLVAKLMDDHNAKPAKAKAADFANFLIKNAL